MRARRFFTGEYRLGGGKAFGNARPGDADRSETSVPPAQNECQKKRPPERLRKRKGPGCPEPLSNADDLQLSRRLLSVNIRFVPSDSRKLDQPCHSFSPRWVGISRSEEHT